MFEQRKKHYRPEPSLLQTLFEAVGALFSLGRRSLLALFGIAIGCAAIIALINIGRNAEVEAVSVFKNMGVDTLVASFPYSVSKKKVLISTIDSEELTKKLPMFMHVAPIALYSSVVRSNGQASGATVIGTTSDLSAALHLNLSSGRFISKFDKRSTYVVLGSRVAHDLELFNSPIKTGSLIQIDGYIFEVVGIVAKHLDNPLVPMQVDGSVFIPIEGMNRLQSTPQINAVVAKARDSISMEYYSSALYQYVSSVSGRDDLAIQAPQQLIESITNQAKTFSLLLTGLGGISLLVGGGGVMNVMLMSVAQRRKEIGVRMAIGAKASDILNLFLMEAICLSIAGALVGAVVGVLIAYLFSCFSGWHFKLVIESLPLGIGCSLIVGLFFGIHPALSAARLQPIQALRDD